MSKKKSIAQSPEAVTSRFLIVMDGLISKAPGSKIRTAKDFAATINADYSYLSKISNRKNRLNVTVAMCVNMCVVHGVNGDWLLSERGEMYGAESKALKDFETRLKKVENHLKL
jgi:hypothetical protein